MVDSEKERDKFWTLFERILNEGGNTFAIKTAYEYGKKRGYSTINKKSANCSMCLGIDFHIKYRDVRVSIYFANKKYHGYYERLKEHKEEIEKILEPFNVTWYEHETAKANPRRVGTIISYDSYDDLSYSRVIEEAIPITERYLEVCRKYLSEALDF